MSFRIQMDRPLALEIKRIAEEQTSNALEKLSWVESHDGDFKSFTNFVDDAIHGARKSLKKARAVLRLVRDEIGEDVYGAQNASYRDAGRLLANARESYVRVETLESLRDQYGEPLDSEAIDDLRAELAAQHEECRAQLFEDRENMRGAIALIELARTDIPSWQIDDDFSALRDGLRRTYGRGGKRMREAYERPSPERFHEWRKRVKYHWYHMRLLKSLWPKVLARTASDIHRVADYLGDAHDLSDFESTLAGEPVSTLADQASSAVAAPGPDRHSLAAMAEQERRRLETAALPLAARIYVESPKRFVDRMQGYWSAARIESTATAASPTVVMAASREALSGSWDGK